MQREGRVGLLFFKSVILHGLHRKVQKRINYENINQAAHEPRRLVESSLAMVL